METLLPMSEEVSNTMRRSLVIKFLVQYQEPGKDSKMLTLIMCIN